MTNKKSVLIIGIDPVWIDFSAPEFVAMPGITPEKIREGINGSANQLIAAGYDADVCWIDLGQTANMVVKEKLQNKSYHAVVIGAGIRVPETNFTLFENLINTIHEFAPQAKICFNTKPANTAEAVQRWVTN